MNMFAGNTGVLRLAESPIKPLGELIAEEQVRDRVNNPKNYIEAAWFRRAAELGLKGNSMAYKKAEVEFFTGAMAALCAVDPRTDDKISAKVPVVWLMNAMSGRPIAGK